MKRWTYKWEGGSIKISEETPDIRNKTAATSGIARLHFFKNAGYTWYKFVDQKIDMISEVWQQSITLELHFHSHQSFKSNDKSKLYQVRLLK